MFYQLFGHPFAQSSWHVKVTITMRIVEQCIYLLCIHRLHIFLLLDKIHLRLNSLWYWFHTPIKSRKLKAIIVANHIDIFLMFFTNYIVFSNKLLYLFAKTTFCVSFSDLKMGSERLKYVLNETAESDRAGIQSNVSWTNPSSFPSSSVDKCVSIKSTEPVLSLWKIEKSFTLSHLLNFS